jgi:carboxyl-terminal processing protease
MDQAEQAAAEATTDTVPRENDPAATDSAIRSRPVYHTDAGRVVRGGGGIVPDIVVRADTLSEGEREFAKDLGTDLPQYRDVLTNLALEYKTKHAVPSERFTITPEMRQQVYQGLTAKGVKMKPEVFAGAGRLVDDQLGYEIARYVFGRPAEFRRRAADQRDMQTALQLLRRAQSPKDLLGLAMSTHNAPSRN